MLGGPKTKLCLEIVAACLEYICVYRTYAYVAASYGVCGSSIFRIIKLGRKHSDKGWQLCFFRPLNR
jgi:hypothetical protein